MTDSIDLNEFGPRPADPKEGVTADVDTAADLEAVIQSVVAGEAPAGLAQQTALDSIPPDAHAEVMKAAQHGDVRADDPAWLIVTAVRQSEKRADGVMADVAAKIDQGIQQIQPAIESAKEAALVDVAATVAAAFRDSVSVPGKKMLKVTEQRYTEALEKTIQRLHAQAERVAKQRAGKRNAWPVAITAVAAALISMAVPAHHWVDARYGETAKAAKNWETFLHRHDHIKGKYKKAIDNVIGYNPGTKSFNPPQR